MRHHGRRKCACATSHHAAHVFETPVTPVTTASRLDQFTVHERMLWRVLGTLARHGFVAPPDEGRDLIHDFYLEAWPGVMTRFDGTRSAFTTYLTAAFYKFARRRIVGLQEWRHRLVDLDAIADRASEDRSPPEAMEDGQQVAFLTRALGLLPAAQRQALYAYASAEDGSERAVARRLSMSRYALKETLANAVGRLATELGKTPAKSSLEARVAHCLWSEGRSPRGTAARLGVSVAEVNAAKTKFVTDLLQAVHSVDDYRVKGREAMNKHLLILQAALRAPGEADALEQVRSHSGEILEALEELDGDFDLGAAGHHQEGRNWVATVYSALAGRENERADETAISLAMNELRSKEAREVGVAFAELVCQVRWLSSWREHFPNLPEADERTVEYLARDESVQGAGEHGQALLALGLTPMMFFGATRGLQLMFDRVSRSAEGRADSGSLLRWLEAQDLSRVRLDVPRHGLVPVPREALVRQVAGTKHLPLEAAEPMADWTVRAVEERPYLVGGYLFDADTAAFAKDLTPWRMEPGALMARWCERAPVQAPFQV